MIATLLRLAGINVNVKNEICSLQSGQKTPHGSALEWGVSIYIYINIYIFLNIYIYRTYLLFIKGSLGEKLPSYEVLKMQ